MGVLRSILPGKGCQMMYVHPIDTGARKLTARANGIAMDLMRRVVQRHRFSELHNRRLGCAVRS